MARLTNKQLDELAHSLAYDAAVASISSFCIGHFSKGAQWFDLNLDSNELPEVKKDVADAERYLEARGLLLRHANHETWVQIHDESEATPMTLNIQVTNEAGAVLLAESITVPDDIPFPDEHSNALTLVGLKTAIDFHFYDKEHPAR